MPPASEAAETVLIVDDEDPVRRTFREWLVSADLGCRVLTAADAASALALADQNVIDLAILDWNLGAGQDGLQLLEDLTAFHPDIVAIMITGYANQATPLMAMRMGVRDYLDKNQHLTRETFLAAIARQLERIRPARREKRLALGLAAFRAAVERILPLVETAAALRDPVPLPTAIRSLFAFLTRTTKPSDGVLVVYSPEANRVYDTRGQALDGPIVPVNRSLAGWVLGMQEPALFDHPDRLAADGSVELQAFERGAQQILAAPITVTPGVQVVIELLAQEGDAGFTEANRELLRASAELGGELLRQALAEHQTHRLLSDAVAAALRVGDEVARTMKPVGTGPDAPPDVVLEQLQRGLREGPAAGPDVATTIRLAEAIRVLALRYGPSAVAHCLRLIEDLRALLDEVSGAGEVTA
jgi:two-component system, NtrC family, nitrogen regulation response regulator NtrX